MLNVVSVWCPKLSQLLGNLLVYGKGAGHLQLVDRLITGLALPHCVMLYMRVQADNDLDYNRSTYDNSVLLSQSNFDTMHLLDWRLGATDALLRVSATADSDKIVSHPVA